MCAFSEMPKSKLDNAPPTAGTTEQFGNACPDFPPFEGVEKRLIIEYDESVFKSFDFCLHHLSLEALSRVTDIARCKILSSVTSPFFDGEVSRTDSQGHPRGYLLSESSLFVWNYRIEIKTCGTTAPILAIQAFHDEIISALANETGKACVERHANDVSSIIRSVRFSRIDFLFPEQQQWPHRSFDEERDFLSQFFSNGECLKLSGEGGRDFYFFGWTAAKTTTTDANEPFGLTEIIMTGVSEDCQDRFLGKLRSKGRDCCLTKVIKKIETANCEDVDVSSNDCPSPFPLSAVDEYWFEPRGYSCNGVIGEEGRLFDVHISPEKDVAYASIEVALPLEALLVSHTTEENNNTGGSILSMLIDAFQPRDVAIVGFDRSNSKKCQAVSLLQDSFGRAFKNHPVSGLSVRKRNLGMNDDAVFHLSASVASDSAAHNDNPSPLEEDDTLASARDRQSSGTRKEAKIYRQQSTDAQSTSDSTPRSSDVTTDDEYDDGSQDTPGSESGDGDTNWEREGWCSRGEWRKGGEEEGRLAISGDVCREAESGQ